MRVCCATLSPALDRDVPRRGDIKGVRTPQSGRRVEDAKVEKTRFAEMRVGADDRYKALPPSKASTRRWMDDQTCNSRGQISTCDTTSGCVSEDE